VRRIRLDFQGSNWVVVRGCRAWKTPSPSLAGASVKESSMNYPLRALVARTVRRARNRTTRTRSRNQSGFTLIELLVVIVILGVLSGVVVFAVSVRRAAVREARGVEPGAGDRDGTPARADRAEVVSLSKLFHV
jgi:prepilin-type N-terminal cleavage/methylation domain-containing protein